MAFNVTDSKRVGSLPLALGMQNSMFPSYSAIIVLSHLVFRNPSDIYNEKPPNGP